MHLKSLVQYKMKKLPIKKYVIYLFGVSIFVFIINKLYIRPYIFENDVNDFFQIMSYSVPNLIEAIIGTLLLTGILMQIRQHFSKKFGSIKVIYINVLAVSLASIYVISQELNFHSLGGNNVYDPYDIIASVIGLLVTFSIVQYFGFTEKN